MIKIGVVEGGSDAAIVAVERKNGASIVHHAQRMAAELLPERLRVLNWYLWSADRDAQVLCAPGCEARSTAAWAIGPPRAVDVGQEDVEAVTEGIEAGTVRLATDQERLGDAGRNPYIRTPSCLITSAFGELAGKPLEDPLIRAIAMCLR